jgi:hypothetical protein
MQFPPFFGSILTYTSFRGNQFFGETSLGICRDIAFSGIIARSGAIRAVDECGVNLARRKLEPSLTETERNDKQLEAGWAGRPVRPPNSIRFTRVASCRV